MTLQFGEAVRDCDRAIALKPDNAKSYFRKATALKSQGKIDEAIRCLNDGLVHDPQSTVAKADIASLEQSKAKLDNIRNMMQQKRYRQALPEIDAMLQKLGSGIWELNMMKIEALLETQRMQEAYNLTNVLMRNSNHVDVQLLHLRARCFYDMGDLENAVKHLQQALRSDPDNSSVRTWYRKLRDIEDKKSRGATAYTAGLYQDAIDLWREAIDLDRSHRSVNAKLHCNCANGMSMMVTGVTRYAL